MDSRWVSPRAPSSLARARASADSRTGLARTLLAVALLSAGCSLDTRTLGGAELGGTSGSSGSGAAGSGSQAGSRPSIDLPVCSYSEANVEPGCESIVSNAGFAETIDPWAVEPLAIAAFWDEGDADGSADSGSISVINSMHGVNVGLASGGVLQCLPASPGQVFGMAGDVYIPEGQGEGLPAVSENCSQTSPTSASFQTNLVQDTGTWTHVEGSAVAPDSAKSMSVRVLTVKSFKQFKFKAIFDNVLLQRE
jgi:hypothetical protein